jgi:hypothetical protein
LDEEWLSIFMGWRMSAVTAEFAGIVPKLSHGSGFPGKND